LRTPVGTLARAGLPFGTLPRRTLAFRSLGGGRALSGRPLAFRSLAAIGAVLTRRPAGLWGRGRLGRSGGWRRAAAIAAGAFGAGRTGFGSGFAIAPAAPFPGLILGQGGDRREGRTGEGGDGGEHHQ